MTHPYETLSDRDKYHLSIGQLVSAWNLVETEITWISLVLHRFGEGALFEKEPPRALARKLTMIAKAVGVDIRLDNLRDLVNVVGQSTEVLALERNILMHGSVLQPFDDLPSVRLRLDFVDWVGGEPPEEMRPISHAEILKLIPITCDLAMLARQLTDGLTEILIADQPQ